MKIRIAAPLLMSALAAPAFAIDYVDSAPVVSSVPVYQAVNEPQQQCWTESVTSYEEHRSPGGVILGASRARLKLSKLGNRKMEIRKKEKRTAPPFGRVGRSGRFSELRRGHPPALRS